MSQPVRCLDCELDDTESIPVMGNRVKVGSGEHPTFCSICAGGKATRAISRPLTSV